MKREDAARVLSGGTANPADRANQGLVEPAGGKIREEIIVGSGGEEGRRYSVEQDYSKAEREQISSAAAERGDGELSRLVGSGQVKLKVHREEPPPPPSDQEVVTSTAVKALNLRKEQLAKSEAELADHRLSRAALEHLALTDQAWEHGHMSDEEMYARQADVLQSIEAIEDESLRHDTYETALASGLDEEIYERHALALQEQYAEHEVRQHEARVQRATEEIERDSRTQEAVIALEEQRLNSLSPVAQGIARSMISDQSEAIAQMGSKEMFVALAYVRHAAKLMAEEIEADNIEANIVKAFPGKMRDGYQHLDSRRERREYDVHSLGLASDPWSAEKGRLAMQRAQAEVERDIKTAQRQRAGKLSGKEQADIARAKLAARMTK